MRVVDTSAWIEWLGASALETEIDGLLPANEEWLVPTMVQYELAKWYARETAPADRARETIAFSGTCVVAPMTTSIALLAVRLGRDHKLATADAVIYATARENGADLLTCDAHFEGLPEVIYIRKRASMV